MSHPLDFSLIKQAGVSQSQFAQLCGVSRVTANIWANGGTPGKARMRRVTKVLDLLKAAVARGVLPVPADSQLEKTQRVLDAMASSHLKA